MTHAVLARRGALLSGAILIAGCLLLTACSGGISSSSASGETLPAAHGAASSAGGVSQGGSVRGPADLAVQTADLAPASQSIIYTASMTVRSGNVAAAVRRIIGIVVAAGGYTADEHAVTGSPGNSGETVGITLKVPVPVYQTVLGQLSSPALGKQLSMRQQATDVTQQVSNVNSLVTSQQDAISALQVLLKRAASVSGLLQVQQQISADESTLNSLLAQQRALDHETTYATVTMTLVSAVHKAAVHKKPTQHGFVGGLAAGWRALKRATSAVLTAIGAALPFLIVAVVLAGIGYAGRRRFIRHRPGPTAAD